MKASKKWIVSKTSGVRPAGKQDECFYCNEKVGSEHKLDCVIRKRTVVVATTIYHTISVPESWRAEDINFQRNESSSCATNIVDELTEMFRYREDNGNDCYCFQLQSTYEREALGIDEKDSGVFVDKDEELTGEVK